MNSLVSISDFPQHFYHSFVNSAQKFAEIVHIVAVEAFANFRYVTPNAASWYLNDCFNPKITSFPISVTVDKIEVAAKLYLYGPLDLKQNEKYAPVLLVHGDYGHPFTLNHLAKIALKRQDTPVFTLYIPEIHHDEHFSEQGILIDSVIDRIKHMIEDQGGIFEGILAAGHSKGGMLLIDRQFSSENPFILRTFAVGAPLDTDENHFEEPLRTILRNLVHKIQKCIDRKFFQVIGENDWVAPRKAMAVRPDEHCYLVPGMHLSGLYSIETEDLFERFLCPQ